MEGETGGEVKDTGSFKFFALFPLQKNPSTELEMNPNYWDASNDFIVLNLTIEE